MNGRIYDPLLGRFLSADVMVQFPGDLQSYNRYSYVQNNPLSLVDPSGFAVAAPERNPATVTTVIVIATQVATKVPAPAAPYVFAGTFATAGLVVSIHDGLGAYEAHQQEKRTAQELKETQERIQRRGTAPNPAERNNPNQASPHEVKIDPNSIQNSQGDTVKTNQSPTQETKPDAPKTDEKPSSKKGRDNLDKDGRPVGEDEAAHHIVAGTDKRAAEARALLAEAGIGINDAANLVGLPQNTNSPNPDGKAVHSTIHTDKYHDSVTETLRNTAPEDREAALRAIREKLEKGKK